MAHEAKMARLPGSTNRLFFITIVEPIEQSTRDSSSSPVRNSSRVGLVVATSVTSELAPMRNETLHMLCGDPSLPASTQTDVSSIISVILLF